VCVCVCVCVWFRAYDTAVPDATEISFRELE